VTEINPDHANHNEVDALIALLTVTNKGNGRFIGGIKPDGIGRVFGGQVIAQALVAAQSCVDKDRIAHSLHAYFMRPGAEGTETEYQVAPDYDGGSFSNRRVAACQDGKTILSLTASFQRPETGLSHQAVMPDVPMPEALKTDAQIRAELRDQIPERFRKMFMRPRPFESRPVETRNWVGCEKAAPVQNTWFRLAKPIDEDPAMHQAILAYATDMALLSTGTLPHGLSWMQGTVFATSIDHAIWFHAPCRVDEWLLYACQSPWTGGGRSMNFGSIFTLDGRLVASTAQEGLMREIKPADSA
jgi:acyl-CoA thioesterase II